MPELSTDSSDKLLAEAEASVEDVEEVPPEYIFPLFFTSKTQEIFECKADEDVTTENPHKIINKDMVLQDYKDRAAISDFHPAKSIILVKTE